MDELSEFVSAILQRGATSASNHAACLKELSDLLDEDGEQFPVVFHDALVVFLFSKQLRTEPAQRLRDLFAKFVGAPDREQFPPKARELLSKTISKCMSTLKRSCQVQDTDIRACSMAMLATITKFGARWWPEKVHNDLVELYFKRLEDKINGVRQAAGDCVCHIWDFLSDERRTKLERRLRLLAREDPRAEVRSVALKCLPATADSVAIVLERTGDYDGGVRTSALKRLVSVPLDLLNVDAVHLLVSNAYTAALNYDASMTSAAEKEEDPQPLEEAEGRDAGFSASARRRREESALYAVLDMLLIGAGGSVWSFLNWCPLESNAPACLFVLHTLFMHGLTFPEDFSTREMIEPLDTHKNVAVAVVYCERLAKTAAGRETIETLVPEPLAVCDELAHCAVDSAKTFLLLRLCKFLDYSDESGRSGTERAILDVLKAKPPTPIVKLALSTLCLVQNVVQRYTEQVVQVLVSEWLDYTDTTSWTPLLSATSELLSSIPTDSVEFPALSRIEEDILGPAKKPVSDSSDPTLHSIYTKCIASLGRFVSRTRDEHFDDLCFWITNPKKSSPLRAASITALVDWFLLPNITLNGSMDIEGLATALLKVLNETPLNSPLTFAAAAGLIRLLFSNKVVTDAILSQFFHIAFVRIPADARLKALLSSFLPTWSTYPESRPIICDGFLHLIRHFSEDLPTPQRKMIFRYILRLIFDSETQISEMGKFNFAIAKKCLKTAYSSERTEPMEILKELDFVGLSEVEKEQIDRMLGKLASKHASYATMIKKIVSALMNPSAPKKRSTAKFPELPQKKEKPGNPQLHIVGGGRASLDSDAHKRLSTISGRDAGTDRTKKRPHEAITKTPHHVQDLSGSSSSALDHADTSALSQLRHKYAQLDDYKLSTAAPPSPKTRSSVAASSHTNVRFATPTKPTSTSAAKAAQKLVPATEPRPKKAKLMEDENEEEELTDTNALLRQLEMRLGTDSKAMEKIKDLSKMLQKESPVDANSRRTGLAQESPAVKRKLVSRTKLAAKMEEEEEEEEQSIEVEPVTSRPKRTRASALSHSQEGPEDEVDTSSLSPLAKRAKLMESTQRSPTKPSRNAKPSTSSQEQGASPSASQVAPSRTTRSMRSSSSSSLELTQGRNPAKNATEDPQADWKRYHFPSLSGPKGATLIGLLGFSSRSSSLDEYQQALTYIGIDAIEVRSFEQSARTPITHLVIRHGEEPSRTSCCFGITGSWIMSEKWLHAVIKAGKLLPEDKFGGRITKDIFRGQSLFFSPQLQSNATVKRITQAMVKAAGGNTTINGSKAHYILATIEDDVPYLLEQFEETPVISVTKLIADIHQYL